MEEIKKELPTLYSAARSAYEQEGDPDKARQWNRVTMEPWNRVMVEPRWNRVRLDIWVFAL